jgi:hypothetical protein
VDLASVRAERECADAALKEVLVNLGLLETIISA